MERKPIIHPIVQSYLDQVDIAAITENYTRPVKITFPQVFVQNMQHLKALLDGEMIDYTIYFANKATKSDALVRTAKEVWIWIDVSSYQELQDALHIGYDSRNILANGPKDSLFLKLCLENNIMISVDSIGEIQKIIDLNILSQSKIMLRICPPKDIAHSRFGITQEELLANKKLIIQFQKLHLMYWLNFHIDSIETNNKQEMIKYIIDIREKLIGRNIPLQQLWIWWWFGIQYTKNIGNEKQILKEYPQWKRLYWIDVLDELLHTTLHEWFDFKTYLRETMTTLHIEPWRFLLDKCWICIHTIIDKKHNKLFIDGNIYSLWSIAQEMPHNPIPYTKDKIFSDTLQSFDIYGNLCLEADKIYSRPVLLPQNIGLWDVLIFINTAWYFWDFSDAQPIKHNERKEIIIQ